MRRRLAVFFAAAFVSVFGAVACGGGAQEDVQKQGEEQAKEGQQQVEGQLREATQQIEQQAQEAKQKIGQETQEVQKQGKEQRP